MGDVEGVDYGYLARLLAIVRPSYLGGNREHFEGASVASLRGEDTVETTSRGSERGHKVFRNVVLGKIPLRDKEN